MPENTNATTCVRRMRSSVCLIDVRMRFANEMYVVMLLHIPYMYMHTR